MTLAYFSNYSHKKYSGKKKKHMCVKNHTIASFTPLAKKKKKINSCFCPQISSGASLWNVQFNLVLIGHSSQHEFIYNSVLISSQLETKALQLESPLLGMLDIVF